MVILIAGLVVFLGVHTLTTLREPRAALIGRLGDRGYRNLYSLVATIGLVLIVWGFALYRQHDYLQVWRPPAWLHPIAFGLMWFSFVALAAAYAPSGRIKGALRHPMLVGVKSWALAHLLVNGDLGAFLLFGAFILWAGYDRVMLRLRDDFGAPAADRFTRGDAIALAVGTLAWFAMFWLHPWLIGLPIS